MPELGRTKPCAHCPWLRTSAPGYLGADTPLHFYQASVSQEGEMPCHEQIDYGDPHWIENQLPHVDLCAGNLIYFNNYLKRPRNFKLAAACDDVGTSPHVFSRPEEYFAHHAPEEDPVEVSRRARFPFG